MMSLETEFAAEIVREYEQSGWEIATLDDDARRIGFIPDVLLKKGDQHLFIEIKREGFNGSRAIDQIKSIIESERSWQFELKIIPRNWNVKSFEANRNDVDARVRVADKLRLEGNENEATILYWTAIEASLRRLLGIDASRDVGSSALIREAYEEGVIVDAELRDLQASLRIRNGLVHGLNLGGISDGSETIRDLARSFNGRLRSVAGLHHSAG